MDRLPGDTVVLLAQHALPSPCLLTDPRFSSGHHPLPKAAHATQALVNPCIPLEILNVKILRKEGRDGGREEPPTRRWESPIKVHKEPSTGPQIIGDYSILEINCLLAPYI